MKKNLIKNIVKEIFPLLFLLIFIFILNILLDYIYSNKNALYEIRYTENKFGIISLDELCNKFNCDKIIYQNNIYYYKNNRVIEREISLNNPKHLFDVFYYQKGQIFVKYKDYYIHSVIIKDFSKYNLILLMFAIIIIVYFFVILKKFYIKSLKIYNTLKSVLSNEIVVAFAENLHHEINTPLHFIDNELSKLYEKGNIKEDYKYLKEAINQLWDIVDKISDYKNIKYSNGNKSIYDIVKSAFHTTFAVSYKKMDYEIDERLKNYRLKHNNISNGDLMSIFTNLIKNSLDAEATYLKVKFEKEKKSKLYILFIDNGNGINDKVKRKIFNPNFSTKGRKRGNGLYINKLLLNYVGGEINLYYSEKNKGAIFQIIIPVERKKE